MKFRRSLLPTYTICLALVGGCARGDRSPLGDVTGSVTYQGQPLQSGTIVFEVSGARPANGKIVAGKIAEVTTYDPDDGVPVGQARIAVFATEPAGSSAPAAAPPDPGGGMPPAEDYMGADARSLIPERYNDPATSGLTWEIKPGDNVVTLELVE